MNGEVFARFYSHTNSYRKLLTAGTEKLAGSSLREALLLVVQSRGIALKLCIQITEYSTGAIYIFAHTHY